MIKRISTKQANVRAGVTAVEFAVVFPIVLLFIFGLFELSAVYRVGSGVKTALAKAGREASILSSSNSDIEAEIRGALSYVGVSNPTITVNPAVINGDTTEIEIDVAVDATVENGFYFRRFFTGQISRTVVFRRI